MDINASTIKYGYIDYLLLPFRPYEPLNEWPFGYVFPSRVADLMQKERM